MILLQLTSRPLPVRGQIVVDDADYVHARRVDVWTPANHTNDGKLRDRPNCLNWAIQRPVQKL
jgi:hypothetical protein